MARRGDGEEEEEVAVSQSLGPPSLEAREQFQRSRKGAETTEVGTDLCDTHAARRITHSLAHNIHPPGPAEHRSAPFPGPPKGIQMRDRRTNTVEPRPTWRYLLRIGIMLSQCGYHRERRDEMRCWKRVSETREKPFT